MPTLTRLIAPAFAATMLFAGCTQSIAETRSHPVEVEQQIMLPVSRVAELLNLDVEEGGHYKEVFAKLPNGDGFNIDAAHPQVYLFRGTPRHVEDPYIQYKDGEVLIPSGMYQSMCKDAGRMDAMLKGGDAKYDSGLAGKIKLHPPTTDVIPSAGPTVTENRSAKPAPPVAATGGSLKGKLIVVDAGHGGKDPGGCGDHPGAHVDEKNICLPVALRVKALLEAEGARVLMTRTDDTFVELQDRADLANNKSADLFISIHANTAPDATANGVECYFQDAGERGLKSATFAKRVVDAMAAKTGANNRGAKTDKRGLRVLRVTTMPAVLVEMGYMTNSDEARKLATTAYQEKLAMGIADGLKAFVQG